MLLVWEHFKNHSPGNQNTSPEILIQLVWGKAQAPVFFFKHFPDDPNMQPGLKTTA